MTIRSVLENPTSTWRWIIFLCLLWTVLAQTKVGSKSEEGDYAPAAISRAILSLSDAYRVTSSLVWWGVDLAMETAGYGVCPFADDPVKAAMKALEERVRAQPLAVESLSKSLSAWHFSQQSGWHEPLVVALTGSTGTGKTETAWVLAEAMLTKRCRISGGTRDIPRGLLVFNGGDYMTASRVEEYQKQIRNKLGQRLEFCGGNVVVLFDELQKAAPGTLDALTEAMSEHPRVTYDDGGHSVSVDSSRVVFLLVSDVGAEGVNAAVLRYRRRSDVIPRTTPNLYQTRSARSLADGVSRLRFGKMVDKVIPYLPMDPASNLQVIELKLQRLADTLPGGMYTTSDLRWHLVQPRYIQYATYHVKLDIGGSEEVIRHDLALYGARDAEKESMRRITSTLREHVLPTTCSAAADGEGLGAGDIVERVAMDTDQVPGVERLCWEEPFLVDIRYETSTDQVSFYRCAPYYAEGLTELQREHLSAVEGSKCELAWRGILHDHGSL
ncbi:unnamed protein product [Ascophyllum nodosum]